MTRIHNPLDGSQYLLVDGTRDMTGTLGVLAGTVSLPGIYFTGDVNTGIYTNAADRLCIAAGGTLQICVDRTNGITFTQDITVNGEVNPGSTGVYDLGTSALKWNDLFLNGSITIGDGETIGSVSDPDVITIDASGNATFSVFPITPSAAPDADYEVANKKYVDDNAGGGGTPGGSDTHIQFNNSSAFGGVAAFIWDDSRCDVTHAIGATADETKGYGLVNTTAAISGTPQFSPSLYLTGGCYRTTGPGSGAKTTEWRAYNHTTSGENFTLHNQLRFQSKTSDTGGTTWKDCLRLRTTSKNGNNGLDVVGPDGLVSDAGLYPFAIQNNASGVDFQIINSTYNVEGVGFFTGVGDTFQIYCTEGGGLEVIPDDAESLIALKISNEGTFSFLNNTSANDVLLTFTQAEAAFGFIDFAGTASATTTAPISTYTTSGAIQGHLQIEVNGTKRWIPFYADPS